MIFLCFFFLFNTLDIDSNSDKRLIYDKKNIHEENSHILYFYDMDSQRLKNVLEEVHVMVLSYIIDDKKYYAKNIDELIDIYIEDKPLNEKIYYLNHGIIINGVVIRCENKELIKIENITSVI